MIYLSSIKQVINGENIGRIINIMTIIFIVVIIILMSLVLFSNSNKN